MGRVPRSSREKKKEATAAAEKEKRSEKGCCRRKIEVKRKNCSRMERNRSVTAVVVSMLMSLKIRARKFVHLAWPMGWDPERAYHFLGNEAFLGGGRDEPTKIKVGIRMLLLAAFKFVVVDLFSPAKSSSHI
ncbi:hypothetical protein NE237_031794 [Protea cynaroides]|uniref:Uncharacterized protein n=1 Tax=Protea cynaroides TaxID=273540 RepID=A0A9Q0L230_9MAGN|nr:hypothetical protein NE237_031794 [Protea cynaroides]